MIFDSELLTKFFSKLYMLLPVLTCSLINHYCNELHVPPWLDYLIHKVFRQNEDGKELLGIWMKNGLINKTIFYGGCEFDTANIAYELARQNFIRDIYITCENVEKGQ